ncbi:flagellar basal-body rod protein FlgG [Paenibacillus baekrokdamisoli]|uniref:Flagellar basal-body rod protein FlgG n=1 Tax=Paenibacillus baekrokdamisoli TaxID=1712516 RepID=A0A3G9JLH1_9BACL|nr:flagellar hook-basal body protein [Paenibacillus baekrokdamisoli]MBB3069061.1 flagellar basal-body rod protein FlgG [Paenibacillus baekrokdamisoli]BBH23879.1 flagellar basal-body rod protein FlgG [Paenibacillus baekrokdamisoli]
MNGSMINAMVSMNGLQQKLDILADNIANSNTVGYKRKEGNFEDLLTTLKQQPSSFSQPGRLTPLGFNQGWGSRLTNIQPDLSQGPLQQTDQPYDIAIEGNALFEVITDAAGNRAYTRGGTFQTSFDSSGNNILTTKDGYAVSSVDDQHIEIPPEVHAVRIDTAGHVLGELASGETVALGQLKMVQAVKPSLLSQVSDNLFTVADGVNVAAVIQKVVPGDGTGVTIRQGFLEQSNVNLTDEMTELISVQRAYQLSARALSSSDTMLGLANNLRG